MVQEMKRKTLETMRYLDSAHVLWESLVLLADLEGQLTGVAHDDHGHLEGRVNIINLKIFIKSMVQGTDL